MKGIKLYSIQTVLITVHTPPKNYLLPQYYLVEIPLNQNTPPHHTVQLHRAAVLMCSVHTYSYLPASPFYDVQCIPTKSLPYPSIVLPYPFTITPSDARPPSKRRHLEHRAVGVHSHFALTSTEPQMLGTHASPPSPRVSPVPFAGTKSPRSTQNPQKHNLISLSASVHLTHTPPQPRGIVLSSSLYHSRFQLVVLNFASSSLSNHVPFFNTVCLHTNNADRAYYYSFHMTHP